MAGEHCIAFGSGNRKTVPRPKSRSMYPRHGRSASCAFCGSAFKSQWNSKTSTGWTKFCGPKCYQASRSRVAKEALVLRGWAKRYADHARQTADSSQAKQEIEVDPYGRTCANCGCPITSDIRLGRPAKYCGRECRKEANKVRPSTRSARAKDKALRRSALKEGDVVDPNLVFAEASWKCQFCGVDTPESLRGTWEMNAPELDHIVPLSRGGLHVRSNLQCLCRACNLFKSDRTMSEMVARLAA